MSNRREIEAIKRLLHEGGVVLDQIHNDILKLTVRHHQQKEMLEKLRERLAEAELKEQANEMQSMQNEHGDSRQLCAGGEPDVPSEVPQTNEDKPEPS